MKKLMAICFVLVFLLGLVFVNESIAKNGKNAPAASSPAKSSPSKVIKVDTPKEKHADQNEDGIVDRKEVKREKAWDDKGVFWKKEADVNNDGVVDDKELGQWKDKNPLPPDAKKSLDLNNDGVVDDKELMLWKRKHPGEGEPQ
ncbi:MAG: hypothetical protein AB1481_06005 [Candidatus Omnitrophota bacterium]